MVSPFFLFKKQTTGDKVEFQVGLCQPYLMEKWKGGNAGIHKDTLKRQTRFLGLMNPDLVVWPEASTPYALNQDSAWVEELSSQTQTPLLIGAVWKGEGLIHNTISEVLPETGVQDNWYAKRVLVPFGEYVPFPFKWIPGVRKLVGPVGSFKEGNEVKTFSVHSKKYEGSTLEIGPLICYEDIFPRLCRETALAGVDLFFVTTNDAWFGREGCAEQHAAHSVLRAIETQRPFLRCGNAGWSGWIDSNGYQREVLRNEEGSIYFEGATTLSITITPNQFSKASFYVRYGDWFAFVCLFITLASLPFAFRKKGN